MGSTTSNIPTTEQQAIIDAVEDELVVLASAGTGKTGTLVNRYLRHIEGDGFRPDQILTITFTRKAAAEMKERIVAALKAKGRWDDAQIAETGPIQTIHGFCERMLRENSVEAGLDPEYEVLSEAEGDRYRDEAIRESIADIDGTDECVESLMLQLAGVTDYEQVPNAKLENAMRHALRSLRGSGVGFETLTRLYETPAKVLEFWTKSVLAEEPSNVRAIVGAVGHESLFSRIRDAYKELKLPAPKWAAAKSEPERDVAAAHYACGLMALVCSAWAKIDQKMNLEQKLDFAELERRAVSLLESSEHVATRTREQYRAVMVDEAQDVNPVQYRLLSALSSKTKMMVGDPQQSIYGFRQALVELFTDHAQEIGAKRLTANKRSDAGILSFVDLLFGRMWSEYHPMSATEGPIDLDADPPSCHGVELWKQDVSSADGVAAMLKELVDEGTSKRDVTVLVRHRKFAIELQRSLNNYRIDSRIAGGSERFYTRLEVRDLANALCALADPSDRFAFLATLRSPFCGLSLDSIVLIAKEQRDLTSLASFAPPLPEDGEKIAQFLGWFEPLSKYADRLPAWEVIGELFASSGYLESLARRANRNQLLANVRKLLSLAIAEPTLGPIEYAAQVREIQNLRHLEGDAPAVDEAADVVTLMTIHNAKGLEFHTVIVPDTHKPLNKTSKPLEIDALIGMVVPWFERDPSTFHTWVAHRKRTREASEEERILYVALTRAKHRLCIVAHPHAKQVGSFAHRIAKTIGFDRATPPGIRVREASDLEPAEV